MSIDELSVYMFILYLQSLNARNKTLLKDKKRLMVINKVEIERLEKEKVNN